MSKTIHVPLSGSDVTPQGGDRSQPAQGSGGFQDGVYQPPDRRVSIHGVRVPRQQVETETVSRWEDYGNRARVTFETRPVEAQPAVSAQPHNYQPQENSYMQQDHGNSQGAPIQPPDITQVDPYNSAEVAEYNRQNDAYIDARVQAALSPHMEELTNAKWERDYNATLARYGNDPNFKQIADIALQRVIDEGGKITIMEAYQLADNKDRAKPGQKYSAHLPEALRDRKNGIGSLGKIMQHNWETGRSRRR